MNKEIIDLLFSIPDNVDYTDISADLDIEDVPIERVQDVIGLLQSSDKYISFQASRILTSWGVDIGFNFLVELLKNNQLNEMVENRLQGYDETYLHVLKALLSFWANKSDLGEEEQARELIFPFISQIINCSNLQIFAVDSIFKMVTKYHYNEYLPLLRNHLSEVVVKQPEQYWKLHDLIGFFLEIDPDFLNFILIENNLKLQDYGW